MSLKIICLIDFLIRLKLYLAIAQFKISSNILIAKSLIEFLKIIIRLHILNNIIACKIITQSLILLINMLRKIIVSFNASLICLCVVTLICTIYETNLLIKNLYARIVNKKYFINKIIKNEVSIL